MIVTLTGAYRNVGDYLIGERARALLTAFVDSEIVNLNRTSLTASDYDVMNNSKAVILCGGPAYQKQIYPTIYPIDLSKIHVPVVPMGLGWKSHPLDTPEQFQFTPQSEEFIRRVHAGIPFSSVRDILTEQVIRAQGIDNVSMTGCPAWYDLAYIDQDYVHSDRVDQVVVSMPARYHAQIPVLLKFLAKRYPDSRRLMTFHHGFLPRFTKTGLISAVEFAKMAVVGMRYGFTPVDLSKDTKKLAVYDAPNSLHIGYRVHAHIYCLSHRMPSFLINEDIRGVGQCATLGLPGYMADDLSIDATLARDLDAHFASKGASIRDAVAVMKSNFQIMRRFLDMMSNLGKEERRDPTPLAS